MLSKQILLLIFAIGLFVSGCDKTPKIDEDGGYYDEKTKSYRYVYVGRKTAADDPQQISVPREGLVQQVSGTVRQVFPDSIFLEIPQRQTYMILSDPLSRRNKEDKLKQVRFLLKNVAPNLLGFGSAKFRKQWKKYVISRMERELLNKKAVITFTYEGKVNLLRGVVAVYSSSVAEDSKLRNFNLWMIEEGLSHYIFDSQNSPPNHKAYLAAEQSARKQKKGLWKYRAK